MMSPQARLFSIMQVDKTAQLIEQVRQLYRQSVYALGATMVVVLFVVYRLHGEVADNSLWSWFGAIVFINLYLLAWIIHLSRHGLDRGNVHAYMIGYQVEAVLHGAAWGMLPFLLAGTNDSLHQLFAYYVICGMAAGAIATTGMIYRIYLSFMLPMMLPSIVWQLAELGVNIFDMGAIGLLIIFVIAMLFLAHAHYDSVIKTIRLIQQNDQLVDSLRDEAQRSNAANHAKTEFLSNTSHELRTPLNAIMGFSSLLMKFRRQGMPDKAWEYAQNIHQAGSHLSELINQVLDLARIETDKATVDMQAVNLCSLLDDCIDLMRPLAMGHQIRLTRTDDACDQTGIDIHVQADPLRLRQVMINLISNAIKYNRLGGEVDVYCQQMEGRVRVAVEDNGLGIPPDKCQEIFTPFTRVHQHLGVEGTGIGLTVTKKNLELMGSEIQLESEEGSGSRFCFHLSTVEGMAQTHQNESPGREPELPANLDISVLYVEDNPLGLHLMQEIMDRVEGISLYSAVTGEEGYHRALEILPDVIILDINLPDISGMEVMLRLREEPSTRHIPALALSASALAEDVERGLRAGFTEYLKKPCLPDELVARIIAIANRPSTSLRAISSVDS